MPLERHGSLDGGKTSEIMGGWFNPLEIKKDIWLPGEMATSTWGVYADNIVMVRVLPSTTNMVQGGIEPIAIRPDARTRVVTWQGEVSRFRRRSQPGVWQRALGLVPKPEVVAAMALVSCVLLGGALVVRRRRAGDKE